MNMREYLRTAESFLIVGFVLIFICTALVFLFLFAIDWKDWFLGIQIDGLPAGILLFAKVIAAVVIIYLMAQYPRNILRGILACFGYWGFLFIDSAITLQKTHMGGDSSPIIPGVFFFVSILLLILHISITLYGTGEEVPAVPS
jgi:hypothetical protein